MAISEKQPGISPELGKSRGFSFKDALFIFDQDEREKAEEYIKIQNKFEEAYLDNLDLYDLLVKGIQKLSDKLGFEEASHYKLYHLLCGSTLREEDWKKYPLDTPERDFDQLIQNTILPALKDQDKAA